MNTKYDMMETLRTIKNDPELTASQKYFLVACVMSADNKTGKVKNSQENLAHYANISFKTVSKWLNKYPEVMKYFSSKKRGRMLDLWFIKVELEVSLHDTRPSKIREELDDTPPEVEYSEETDADTPPQVEEQSVTEELQSDTPPEIPNTPPEIPNTPPEVEPSTSSSTLSSTNDTPPAAAKDSSYFDSKEESVDSPLVVIDEASPLSVDNEPAFAVLNNDGAPAAPDDEEIDWDAYDAFADYTPEAPVVNEKPANNGGVPENIMNILRDADNVEEAVRLYLDPEFVNGREDHLRAEMAVCKVYQPKAVATSSFDEEW